MHFHLNVVVHVIISVSDTVESHVTSGDNLFRICARGLDPGGAGANKRRGYRHLR